MFYITFYTIMTLPVMREVPGLPLETETCGETKRLLLVVVGGLLLSRIIVPLESC